MFLKPANFFEIFLVFLGEQHNKETQKGEKSYRLFCNNDAEIDGLQNIVYCSKIIIIFVFTLRVERYYFIGY